MDRGEVVKHRSGAPGGQCSPDIWTLPEPGWDREHVGLLRAVASPWPRRRGQPG